VLPSSPIQILDEGEDGEDVFSGTVVVVVVVVGCEEGTVSVGEGCSVTMNTVEVIVVDSVFSPAPSAPPPLAVAVLGRLVFDRDKKVAEPPITYKDTVSVMMKGIGRELLLTCPPSSPPLSPPDFDNEVELQFKKPYVSKMPHANIHPPVSPHV
jgi:hypothetical protein